MHLNFVHLQSHELANDILEGFFKNCKLTDWLAAFPFLELYACNFPLGSICLEFWFECLAYHPGGDVGILNVAEITKIYEIKIDITQKSLECQDELTSNRQLSKKS